MDKKYPNELTVTGTLVSPITIEERTYTDKETGAQKSYKAACGFVQTSFGICVLRFFNPADDLANLKVGETVCYPVDSYAKERGIKVIGVRL